MATGENKKNQRRQLARKRRLSTLSVGAMRRGAIGVRRARRKDIVTIEIRLETLEAIEQVANEDNRSLSELFQEAIDHFLEQREMRKKLLEFGRVLEKTQAKSKLNDAEEEEVEALVEEAVNAVRAARNEG